MPNIDDFNQDSNSPLSPSHSWKLFKGDKGYWNIKKDLSNEELRVIETTSSFQTFWSQVLNEEFQTWLFIERLPLCFLVDVYHKNDEPFVFAVYMKNEYVHNQKIIWFDIQKEAFGYEKLPMTEEDIIEMGKKREMELRTLRINAGRELCKLQAYTEKPYLYMFESFKTFSLIFFQYDRTMKELKKKMKEKKIEIQELDQQIKVNRKNTTNKLKEIEEMKKGREIVKKFFHELQYIRLPYRQ